VGCVRRWPRAAGQRHGSDASVSVNDRRSPEFCGSEIWGRLIKDRDALLAFYDFPAEHWKHLRTSNVIESSFATIRHRTVRSKGSLSNKTALAMIFKLAEAAEKSWRRLDGHNKLPKVILGIKFTDGIEVVRSQAQAAA
jgi:putative transposase